MQQFAQKLALGTVQFGLPYGISNQTGKVTPSEVTSILQTAAGAGINTLDTAAAYGESEQVLGETLTGFGKSFQVVSKLPNVAPQLVAKSFEQTLSALQQNKLYGHLVHDFTWFSLNPGIWPELQKLKEAHLVEKIGFSLYSPDQAVWLLQNGVIPDLVQVPYNLFDQRFAGVFAALKNRGVEVHVRSVFLQGLFFLKPGNLPAHFASVKEKLASIQALFSTHNIPVEAGLLCFAWLCAGTDKLVIGVESTQQLLKNLKAEKYLDQTKHIYPQLLEFAETDPDIILPTNWK